MDAAPSVEMVREFVLAGHFNLERVRQLLAEQPALLNQAYAWQPEDLETAIQAAAHVGNVPIAEYLLSVGSPLEICTAAMLGRVADVESALARDPRQITAVGAHHISLLAHAALSGQVALVEMLLARGATGGVSQALNNAVVKQHAPLAAWLLEHAQPDLAWTDYQGKTALQNARESGQAEIAALIEGRANTV